MSILLRNSLLALTVVGALSLGACKTTDDTMDSTTPEPSSAPAEPMDSTTPPADPTTAPPTDSTQDSSTTPTTPTTP